MNTKGYRVVESSLHHGNPIAGQGGHYVVAATLRGPRGETVHTAHYIHGTEKYQDAGQPVRDRPHLFEGKLSVAPNHELGIHHMTHRWGESHVVGEYGGDSERKAAVHSQILSRAFPDMRKNKVYVHSGDPEYGLRTDIHHTLHSLGSIPVSRIENSEPNAKIVDYPIGGEAMASHLRMHHGIAVTPSATPAQMNGDHERHHEGTGPLSRTRMRMPHIHEALWDKEEHPLAYERYAGMGAHKTGPEAPESMRPPRDTSVRPGSWRERANRVMERPAPFTKSRWKLSKADWVGGPAFGHHTGLLGSLKDRQRKASLAAGYSGVSKVGETNTPTELAHHLEHAHGLPELAGSLKDAKNPSKALQSFFDVLREHDKFHDGTAGASQMKVPHTHGLAKALSEEPKPNTLPNLYDHLTSAHRSEPDLLRDPTDRGIAQGNYNLLKRQHELMHRNTPTGGDWAPHTHPKIDAHPTFTTMWRSAYGNAKRTPGDTPQAPAANPVRTAALVTHARKVYPRSPQTPEEAMGHLKSDHGVNMARTTVVPLNKMGELHSRLHELAPNLSHSHDDKVVPEPALGHFRGRQPKAAIQARSDPAPAETVRRFSSSAADHLRSRHGLTSQQISSLPSRKVKEFHDQLHGPGSAVKHGVTDMSARPERPQRQRWEPRLIKAGVA